MTSQPVVLLGDSILKRLMVKFPNQFDNLSSVTCVSGQHAQELKLLIKEYREEIRGRRVVLLIGTNDFLQKSKFEVICSMIKSILKVLRQLDCRIAVLEAIPIARWGLSAESQSVIGKYNKFLSSFSTSGVEVIKLFDDFVVNGEVDISLFCKHIGKYRRVDLVHPNKKGLLLIFLKLKQHIG